MRSLAVLLVGAASCGHPASSSIASTVPVSSPTASAPSALSAPAEPAATKALAPVYSKALEGDMRAALDRLVAIPVDALDGKEKQQRACILQTFSTSLPPAAPAPDPLLGRVIAAYRDYWARVMLGSSSRDDGKAILLDHLHAALGASIDAGSPPSLDGMLDALGTALSQRGFHSIRGVTAPYQDLLVWKTETAKTYDVRIPDGQRSVDVVLMRDFVSLGWEGFATCDRYHAGGWAEKDRLYCMVDSYDLASEDFSVSYLTHETQHFVDYERFPKLAGPELEYRAKLAEIIESQHTTRALVARFAGQTGDSRDSPHNYANGRLVRDLERAVGMADAGPRWWESPSDDRIRDAARAVFDANTQILTERGAASVSEVL